MASKNRSKNQWDFGLILEGLWVPNGVHVGTLLGSRAPLGRPQDAPRRSRDAQGRQEGTPRGPKRSNIPPRSTRFSIDFWSSFGELWIDLWLVFRTILIGFMVYVGSIFAFPSVSLKTFWKVSAVFRDFYGRVTTPITTITTITTITKLTTIMTITTITTITIITTITTIHRKSNTRYKYRGQRNPCKGRGPHPDRG